MVLLLLTMLQCTYNLSHLSHYFTGFSSLNEIAVIKEHRDLKHSQILSDCTRNGRNQATQPIQSAASPLALGIIIFLYLCYFDEHWQLIWIYMPLLLKSRIILFKGFPYFSMTVQLFILHFLLVYKASFSI